MAGKRLVLVGVAAMLFAASCSEEPARRPLAAGFGSFREVGFGHPPDEGFRHFMMELNMSSKDIDCMAREIFVPGNTITDRTLMDGSDLQVIANRCNVDFSKMSIPVGD